MCYYFPVKEEPGENRMLPFSLAFLDPVLLSFRETLPSLQGPHQKAPL